MEVQKKTTDIEIEDISPGVIVSKKSATQEIK